LARTRLAFKTRERSIKRNAGRVCQGRTIVGSREDLNAYYVNIAFI